MKRYRKSGYGRIRTDAPIRGGVPYRISVSAAKPYRIVSRTVSPVSVAELKKPGQIPRAAQTSLKIPASGRNLSRRPARPAAGNGRVQRQCARAFIAHGGPISTSTAIAWSYRELLWGAPSRNALNRSVRRALASIGAIRIGRASTRGRPCIWKLPDARDE